MRRFAADGTRRSGSVVKLSVAGAAGRIFESVTIDFVEKDDNQEQ